jgi:hypothetical protein
MKINKKYYQLVFGLLMSFFMSISISFVLTLVNTGLGDDFLLIWLKSFAFGFIVAFPISLVVFPMVKKFTDKVLGQ